MKYYYAKIYKDSSLRESGIWSSEDFGLGDDAELSAVAAAIVARRRAEAVPWLPFDVNRIELWVYPGAPDGVCPSRPCDYSGAA